MADPNDVLVDRLARFGARRADRRRAGWLTAALVATFAVPAAASGHGKRRKRKHDGASGPPDPSTGRVCGGIAGIPCPAGFTCVDNPRDSCDPAHGGADCGGVCVRKATPSNPCARIRCASGTVCCRRCGGMCLPPEVPCGSVMCDPQPCGKTTCQPGEYCCNATCSQCALIGRLCRDDVCEPTGIPCGTAVCRAGEYCCNASCNQCAPFGALCTARVCPPQGEVCGSVRCEAGQFCCNASCSQCAPIGGACTARYCPPTGRECGSRTCPDGQVCCNASCGICTAPGGACPMIACLPEA